MGLGDESEPYEAESYGGAEFEQNMKSLGASVSPIEKTSGSMVMPVFDGTNPSLWLSKVKKFFSIGRFADEAKLDLVFLSLEGAALKWFLREMFTLKFRDWAAFEQRLLVRFDPVTICATEATHSTSKLESEANGSHMETDCVSQPKVPVSISEPCLGICSESLDIKKDIPSVLLEENRSQSTPVTVNKIAHQLFDERFLSVRQGKQLTKQSKFSKTWKFRFKNKNVQINRIFHRQQRVKKKKHTRASKSWMFKFKNMPMTRDLVQEKEWFQSNVALVKSVYQQLDGLPMRRTQTFQNRKRKQMVSLKSRWFKFKQWRYHKVMPRTALNQMDRENIKDKCHYSNAPVTLRKTCKLVEFNQMDRENEQDSIISHDLSRRRNKNYKSFCVCFHVTSSVKGTMFQFVRMMRQQQEMKQYKLGEGKFHMKHKWRSKIQHSISGPEIKYKDAAVVFPVGVQWCQAVNEKGAAATIVQSSANVGLVRKNKTFQSRRPKNQAHMSRVLYKRRTRPDLSGVQQYCGGDVKLHMKQKWRSKGVYQESDAAKKIHPLTERTYKDQLQNGNTLVSMWLRIQVQAHLFPHHKLEDKLVFIGGSNGEAATGLGNEMLMFHHSFPVCFWTGQGLEYWAELRIEVHNYEGGALLPPLKNKLRNENIVFDGMPLNQNAASSSATTQKRRKCQKTWMFKYKLETQQKEWPNKQQYIVHGPSVFDIGGAAGKLQC